MHDQPAGPADPARLRSIREGATDLLVPLVLPVASRPDARGPGRSRDGVFFNPAAAFARDLSVLYLAAVVRPGMRVLDGLTGVGARAARWRHEVPGDYRVTANDHSPQAVAVAHLNLVPAGAGAAGVRLLQGPLGALLASDRFDLIEIDAPGSPAPFLDAACRAVRPGPSGGPSGEPAGHLLVTATDTLVLTGVQPGVCLRRYGARPLRGELGHEVAVRILVGAIARAAARYGLAVAPALAYVHGHWYGVFVRLIAGAADGAAGLEGLGHVAACPWCWDRRVFAGQRPSPACVLCGRPVHLAGPLWTGALWDGAIVRRLQALAAGRPLAAGGEVRLALAGWLAEAAAPPLFYDLHAAAAHCAAPTMPRLEAVRQRLAALGHPAVRTHFSRSGIKTDASARLVLDLLQPDVARGEEPRPPPGR